MVLITVDILKKDNPELYEYMKDYLYDTDTPELTDKFIRAIDLQSYLKKIGYNEYEYSKTGDPIKFISSITHSDILWSSKY